MHKHGLWLILRLFPALAAVVLLPAAAVAEALSFGIVPQQSAARLAEDWGPVLAEIGRRSGVQLVFRTAPNIPAFEDRLAKGEYDFAYMNPYHYSVFHDAAGYQAFAKEKGRRLKGLIVVRKDSPHTSLADLAGKTVVFPAPAAFAASVLTRSEFERLGIRIDPKYVASHDSVYRAVSSGLYEAGGGIQRTFEAAEAAGLRVLAQTKDYTPHPFAHHRRVPAETVAKVLAAMVSLAEGDGAKALLDPLAFKGIEPAQDGEWNDVRSLDIRLLEHFSRQ